MSGIAIGIGLGITNTPVAGGGYAPAATALFARFTTPPTAQRKALINSLIVSLTRAGVWEENDLMAIIAAADAQAGQRNWIADQFNLTPVSSPVFTADRGYQGDGVASYLNTNLEPTAATKYLQDDGHIMVWSRTNAQQGGVAMGARTTSTTKQTAMILRNASDQLAVARMNQDASGAPLANSNSSGMFVLRRTGAAVTEVFRNGVSLGTGSVASAALSAFDFYLGALNTGGVAGSFNNYQFAAVSVGGALTNQQIADYYAAMNTYMQAVGAA